MHEMSETPSSAASRPKLAKEALQGLLGEYVEAVSNKNKADLGGLLVSALACAGAALNRGANFQHGYALHRPNVFSVTVTGSRYVYQESFLDPVSAFFRAAADEVQADLFQHTSIGSLVSGDKLLAALSKKLNILDSAILAVGEFDTTWPLLGRYSNKLLDTYRDVWDGGGKLAIVAHAHESDLLSAEMSSSVLDLASRILWCYVADPPLIPSPQALPTKEFQPLAKRLASCVGQAAGYGVVSFDDAAQDLWQREFASLTSARSVTARSVTARGASHVVRLALIFAMLDSTPEIGIAHLKAALAVWQYCRQSADILFGTQVDDALAQRVLSALALGPQSQSEIHGALHNHTAAARLNAALAHLAEQGVIFDEISSTRGRSKRMWFLRRPEGPQPTPVE